MEDKGEVFPKADLTELPKPKTKSKKKRELYAKVKSKPNAKRQKDSVQPLNLRPKHQLPMADKENKLMAIGLGRTKSQLLSGGYGRLRTLHNSKAKVSDTVTSRKILGDLQPNVMPKHQLQYDLQRVLGKDSDSKPITQSRPHETSKANTSGVDMDCSPAKATPPIASCPSNDHPNDPPVPLVEISCRLVEGLQVETIFPQSAYLDNIKAELTKVLKQSNPHGYKELIRYFSSSGPDTTMPSPLIYQLQHSMLPTIVEASGPEVMREPNHCATPPNHTPNQPPGPNTEAAAGTSGVSDTVALNLEVNTSALNISDGSAGHTPRPKDLLDLMDSANGVHHATPPDWNSSPSRPRMFPHKLY